MHSPKTRGRKPQFLKSASKILTIGSVLMTKGFDFNYIEPVSFLPLHGPLRRQRCLRFPRLAMPPEKTEAPPMRNYTMRQQNKARESTLKLFVRKKKERN